MPCRPTIHRSDVVAGAEPGKLPSGELSTSFASPRCFGDRLAAFVAEARAMLSPRTDTGCFSDWPGDTAIVIATKPR